MFSPPSSLILLPVLGIMFMFPFPQGVKPASYNKVMDPEIKEIIGECICQKKEERWVTVQSRAKGARKVPSYLSCRASPPRFIALAVTAGLSALRRSSTELKGRLWKICNSFKEEKKYRLLLMKLRWVWVGFAWMCFTYSKPAVGKLFDWGSHNGF